MKTTRILSLALLSAVAITSPAWADVINCQQQVPDPTRLQSCAYTIYQLSPPLTEEPTPDPVPPYSS